MRRPSALSAELVTFPMPDGTARLAWKTVVEANKIGWYRRTVQIPPQWQGQNVWLRFGAVDWEATVWVNGKEAGKHVGGYTPFDRNGLPQGPRDVYAYVIHEGKVRAPAAAMEFIKRVDPEFKAQELP